jgi:hypothetical protein
VPQSQLLTIIRNTPTLWENFNVQVGCTINDHGVYRAYDNVSVIDVEKHKENASIAQSKHAQPVARPQHGAHDTFTFPAEVFEMSKYLLTPSWSKPRWNSEGILKKHEVFIYGNLCYTGNSFFKNMLKIGTP